MIITATERVALFMNDESTLSSTMEMWKTVGAVFLNAEENYIYTILMCFIVLSSMFVAYLMRKKHNEPNRSRESRKANPNPDKSTVRGKEKRSRVIIVPLDEQYTSRVGVRKVEHPFRVLLGEDGWRAADFIEAEMWFDNPTVKRKTTAVETCTQGTYKAEEILVVEGYALATLTTDKGESVPTTGMWSVQIPLSEIGTPSLPHNNKARLEDLVKEFLHYSCGDDAQQISLSDVLLFAEELHTVNLTLGEQGYLQEISAEMENFKVTTTFYTA